MNLVEKARTSLATVQSLDASMVSRRSELGTSMDFSAAEAPAKYTIKLFNSIAPGELEKLPSPFLQAVISCSEPFLDVFQKIQGFSPANSGNHAVNERQSYIQSMEGIAHNSYTSLAPVIAYLHLSREVVDSASELDAEVNRTKARLEEIENQANQVLREANTALDEARNVAAERGVAQQAHYFKLESERHAQSAENWGKAVVLSAAVAALFSAAALFLHKLPWLTPTSSYEAIQLAVGKTLIFAVAAYLLFLCSRSYLSHKHNEIVNRHRQNALLTYQTLAEAAGTSENRDIVLMQAAACIFTPQETGYTKNNSPPNAAGIIESVPRYIQTLSPSA